MDGELFQVHVNRETEEQAEHANDQSNQQQIVTVNATEKGNVTKVRKYQVRFAALMLSKRWRGRNSETGQDCGGR
jgi:hypothetical protein